MWRIQQTPQVLSGPRLDVNMDGNLVGGLDNSRANSAAGGAFSLGLPGSQVNTLYSQPLLVRLDPGIAIKPELREKQVPLSLWLVD